MALDPTHFSLENALDEIWSTQGFLSDTQKKLISKCTGRDEHPSGENDLDKLHLAVNSCQTLNRIAGGKVHWLSDDGKYFPDITANYIHKVATQLHNYSGELPTDFTAPLIEFVKTTKSHVATLNYDKLIYSPFIEENVLQGYDGALVDGMLSTGFSSDALERLFNKDFGYYLHLHGSPLFMNNTLGVKKMNRDQLFVDDYDRIGRHVVLTHVEHKPSVIANSPVLSVYWEYLSFSLSEAEEIIIFGYSGEDIHLNKLLKPYSKSKTIKVVEWSGSGDQKSREHFWTQQIGKCDSLILLDNILTFTSW